MEPLKSFEGYKILEDVQRSRDMLNQFYQEQGYQVAKPKQAADNNTHDNRNTQRQHVERPVR